MKKTWLIICFLLFFTATGWCYKVEGRGTVKYIVGTYRGIDINVIPHTETLWTVNDCVKYTAGLDGVYQCDAVFGGPCLMQNGKVVSDAQMNVIADQLEQQKIADKKQKEWNGTFNLLMIILFFIVGVPILIALLKSDTTDILEEAVERELKYGKGLTLGKDIPRTPPELDNFLAEFKKMNKK